MGKRDKIFSVLLRHNLVDQLMCQVRHDTGELRDLRRSGDRMDEQKCVEQRMMDERDEVQ